MSVSLIGVSPGPEAISKMGHSKMDQRVTKAPHRRRLRARGASGKTGIHSADDFLYFLSIVHSRFFVSGAD
jgi:hypothetical protein